MVRQPENEILLPYILGSWDFLPSRLGLSWKDELPIAMLGYLATQKVDQIILVHSQAKNARWMTEWLHSNLKGSKFSICHWSNLDYWNDQRHTAISSLVEERMACLANLKLGNPVIINTTADALLTNTTSFDWFNHTFLQVKVGEDIERSFIEDLLRSLGYSQVSRVEEPGSFSFRGAILDFFPAGESTAYRVEFFADTVNSIKTFSTETQRSISTIEQCAIPPFAEFIPPASESRVTAQRLYELLLRTHLKISERNSLLNNLEIRRNLPSISRYLQVAAIPTSLLSDYLADPIWIVDGDPIGLISLADERYLPNRELMKQSLSDEIMDEYLKHRSEIRSKMLVKLTGNKSLAIGGVSANRIELSVPRRISNEMIGLKVSPKELLSTLKKKKDSSWFIFCETIPRLERVKTLLADTNLKIQEELSDVLECFSRFHKSGIYLVHGVWPELSHFKVLHHIAFVPSDILVHERTETKVRRKSKDELDVRSLRTGDFVVHEDHGIGKFLGNVLMPMGNMTIDCLAIEYAGGDRIYVPVTSLGKLEKYSEANSQVNIDKLSGLGWFKRKEKARKAANLAAEELLKIQALRKASKHQPYSEPSLLYQKFCLDFPYKETDDQLHALDDIESDFISDSLMDRLVIGDVGFGKTELAIRAAYRTVLENRQVILICPTTVLSHQHYSTFKARMYPYGVKIAHLNRFVKSKEKDRIFIEFALGQIDILIGTHALLGKKLEASNLGLLIVDEEQKFGVGHKENIKKIRAKSDVLTLSATPIPRTLHMATAGIKDVSVLSSPPRNRIPVRNILCHWDGEMISGAIRAEVNRGGQVFVVHNKIEDIGVIANRISALCPEIELRVGHGKLDSGALEKIMVDFLDQKYQVLLATSIIESGVDIPNVNTIIINNAHQFGLSQLYQLRGRVGRSNIQAFAYLIVPEESYLTADAHERINAIMGHQELGSGFYVANRDLEIRGAGNMLGAEQSGFVDSVGVSLYARLLAAEVKILRGEAAQVEIEPEIKLPVIAFISNDFIADEVERVKYYRHIFRAGSLEVVDDIMEEIIDRFGQPESEFQNLILVAKVRILLKAIGAVSVTMNQDGLHEIKFGPLDSHRLNRIINLSHDRSSNFRLLGDFRLVLKNADGNLVRLLEMLQILSGDRS